MDEDDELLAALDIPPPAKQMAVSETSAPSNRTTATTAETPTTAPVVVAAKVNKSHCILVNPKQRGNPLLKAIQTIPWEYDDVVPDYVVGASACILFLSLRYHNLNPDYIHARLKQLGKMYVSKNPPLLIDERKKRSTFSQQLRVGH